MSFAAGFFGFQRDAAAAMEGAADGELALAAAADAGASDSDGNSIDEREQELWLEAEGDGGEWMATVLDALEGRGASEGTSAVSPTNPEHQPAGLHRGDPVSETHMHMQHNSELDNDDEGEGEGTDGIDWLDGLAGELGGVGVGTGAREHRSIPAASSSSASAPGGAATAPGALVPEQNPLARMALNTHKAGMDHVDKARVNEVILEASRGSKYFENQRERAAKTSKRIEEMLVKLNRVRQLDQRAILKPVDEQVRELEGRRDLSQILVCVDMDMFYAAVEMRDNPSLIGKPIGIGGMSMLSTSNYEARKFGVRAAMPGYIAKKLCPHLIFVRSNFDKYREASRAVQAIFAEYDPDFSAMSLDEAILNITEYAQDVETGVRRLQDVSADLRAMNSDMAAFQKAMAPLPASATVAERIVFEIRCRIFRATKLTASAGIGATRRIAKICSDRNKPNGQCYLDPSYDSVMQFTRELPIRKVPFIGKVTEEMLSALGITNCEQLYEKRGILSQLFKPATFQFFLRVSLGISSEPSSDGGGRKSISVERTFRELSQSRELHAKCDELCASLAKDVAKRTLEGRTLTLKLKTVFFEVLSRAASPLTFLSTAEELARHAHVLLDKEIEKAGGTLRLRLMGVRLSALREKVPEQVAQQAITSYLRTPSSTASSAADASGAAPVPTPRTPDTAMSVAASRGEDDVEPQPPPEPSVSMVCPVCLKPVTAATDLQLNHHVNDCLSKKAIRHILRQQALDDQRRPDAQQVPRPAANKRKTKASDSGAGKTRKRARQKQPDKPSGQGTLDRFL